MGILTKKDFQDLMTKNMNQLFEDDKEMNDNEIEQEIQDKGLTAPRVTQALIDESIVGEEYHLFDATQLTVCMLTLKNGYTVTGESACVSVENFDEELGQKIAKQNAKDKMWALLGFSLAEQLSGTPCVPKVSCGGCS